MYIANDVCVCSYIRVDCICLCVYMLVVHVCVCVELYIDSVNRYTAGFIRYICALATGWQ